MDGWSPEYPVIDEPESESKFHSHDGQYSGDYNDYPSSSQEIYERSNNHHHQEKELTVNLIESTRSDISVDSIERNGGEDRGFGRNQEAFLDELQSRGASIVQVTYPRTANNDKELTVVRGEYLEVSNNSQILVNKINFFFIGLYWMEISHLVHLLHIFIPHYF